MVKRLPSTALLFAALVMAFALVASPLAATSASASMERQPDVSFADADIPWNKPFTCESPGKSARQHDVLRTAKCVRYMRYDYCGSSRAPAVVTWGNDKVWVRQYLLTGELRTGHEYQNGATPNTRTYVVHPESTKIQVDYFGSQRKTPSLTCIGP